MARYIFVIIAVVFSISLYAQQEKYPKDLFRAPLDIPMYLSGTFGELRSNHFHSGIDIKTNAREGYNIYAIGDGYISRIKFSATGFGNALYITHPEGYTSVYAHLQKLAPSLQEYIKKIQYERESFEVEIYPDAKALPVKKGEMIAYSGNSGSSGGPHLHFEIRETATEKPINPLFFGFDIKDNIAPVIQNIVLYDARIPYGGEKVEKINASKSGNKYIISNNSATVNTPLAGIGINAYDQLNGASNRNGVYSVSMKVDGEEAYYSSFEKFSFAETRYLNVHTDYAEKNRYGAWVQRLFRLPGNELSVYGKNGNGLIALTEGGSREIEIIVKDVAGNTSTISFTLRNTGTKPYTTPRSDQVMLFGKEEEFSREDIRINFPADAFYDTIYFRYSASPSGPSDIYSRIHKVHDPLIPVHKYFTISIKPENLPQHLQPKALLAIKDHRGRESSAGGAYENGFVKASVRSFGTFYVTIDTVPPVIRPINISPGKNMSGERNILVRISDDFSGIKSYRGTINGKWVLMSYDAKNNLLTYEFDDDIKPGEHEFVLLVTDDKNNSRTYSAKFKK